MPHTKKPPLPANFASHPQSVGDLRAGKSNLANDWTARDVLIDTLREIDSGEIAPDVLVVMYSDQKADGVRGTGFAVASKCKFLTLGLFGWAKELFVRTNPIGRDTGPLLLFIGLLF